MNFHYNLTNMERELFAETISQILKAPVLYCAASGTYTISSYQVDKNGILSCTKGIAPDAMKLLVSRLREHGYAPLDKEDGTVSYAVGVPVRLISGKTLDNLLTIIAHKKSLFQKALGADELPVLILKGRLWFPWFTLYGFDGEIETYTSLIHTLCKLAQKPDLAIKQVCRTKAGWFAMLLFFLEWNITGKRHEAAYKLLHWNFAGYAS